MKNIDDLGKVTKRHISGVVETDKGNRFPAGVDVLVGDQMIKQDGKKLFVSAEDWKELLKKEKPSFQKGVTKALREKAESLDIEVFESTTKDELVEAIELEEARIENENLTGGGLDV